MSGNLILNADPTANLGAVTKQYVDKENSMIYKRHKLFEVTKSYNNFTGNNSVFDKIFTFQNLTLNNLGFLPQRLLIEFSSQDYMATNEFDIRLALTNNASMKTISLDLPNCNPLTPIRIQNISLNLIVYLSTYIDRVTDPNNINFGGTSIMMPYAMSENFNFTSEYSFFINHHNIDGTITASVYLS